MSDPLILVTGASGYLASHVTKQLQEQGYRVRVTVRNAKNETKVSPIRNFCPDAKYPLEIVEADLIDANSWPKAVEGCTYVIHVASPAPKDNPKDIMEIVQPAVNGTVNVLIACAEAGTVKRVVLTSSVVAIGAPFVKKSNFFTEDDFLKEEDIMDSYYARSKILAEQSAWKYVKGLPEEEKFELAVVNPAFILGPVIHGSHGTSVDLLYQFLGRPYPVLPPLNLMLCDVRDVATAHIKCMTLPEAAGKRHIIASEALWMKEMAPILHREFKPHGYRIPQRQMPHWIAYFIQYTNAQLKVGLRLFGDKIIYDNTRMREVLHITPIPPEKSLIDMGYSMIDLGFVKKTAKYRGRPEVAAGEGRS